MILCLKKFVLITAVNAFLLVRENCYFLVKSVLRFDNIEVVLCGGVLVIHSFISFTRSEVMLEFFNANLVNNSESLECGGLAVCFTELSLQIFEESTRANTHICDFHGLKPDSPALYHFCHLRFDGFTESLTILDDLIDCGVRDSVTDNSATHLLKGVVSVLVIAEILAYELVGFHWAIACSEDSPHDHRVDLKTLHFLSDLLG